jgi:hypothetical protein
MVHTPGPWLREGRFVYALRDTFFAGKPAKENIFDCCVQGHGTPEEEKEANARLIAAAPELLKYLIIMTELVKLKFGHGDDLVYQEVKDAENVIAKAEGKE